MKDYIMKELEDIEKITGYNYFYLEHLLFDTQWNNETIQEQLEEIRNISLEYDWNLTPEESKYYEIYC